MTGGPLPGGAPGPAAAGAPLDDPAHDPTRAPTVPVQPHHLARSDDDTRPPGPSPADGPEAPVVRRLTGVYHADGGLRGELAYVLGRLVGRAHCALCDVTHGTIRRRRSWDECVAALPVPVDLVHRDGRSPDVAAATGSRTPAIVAHTDSGLVEVMGPEELDAVGGDVRRVRAALDRGVARHGLSWPAGS